LKGEKKERDLSLPMLVENAKARDWGKKKKDGKFMKNFLFPTREREEKRGGKGGGNESVKGSSIPFKAGVRKRKGSEDPPFLLRHRGGKGRRGGK